MGLISPLALLLAALGLPIVLFYMLKLRRTRHAVSSTMLWRQALHDLRANAPWQRLRRQILLLLQLITLALLVLGLARPYARSDADPRITAHTTILLDASASMQATDVSPSRFQAARALIGRAIDRMSGDDALTLIVAGDAPHLLAQQAADRAALRRALASAEVTSGEADWQAALDLAAATAREQPGPHTFTLITDGGLGSASPLDLDGEVQFVPIGAQGSNLSIAALAMGQGARALVRLSNAGSERAGARLTLYVDGALYDAREVELDPGRERTLTLDGLPPNSEWIEARIAPLSGEDWLAVDNAAWAVRPWTGDRRTALLSTPGNLFLERALSLLPDLDTASVPVTAPVTAPLPYAPAPLPDGSEVALHIFDGLVPSSLPGEGGLLFINPPSSTDLFTVTGIMTRTRIARVAPDNALLDYVDLGQVHIAQAQRVLPPPWAQAPVEAEGGALLLAGEVGGRRVAILTFDLHQSDLALQVAFPILVSNLARWLAPVSVAAPVAGEDLLPIRPGAPVTLHPPAGAQRIVVVDPLGEDHKLHGQGALPFVETGAPGLYQVEWSGETSSERILGGRFAVNLFSELESDITPRGIPLGTAGEASAALPPRAQAGRQEGWRWALLAGLGVWLIEWSVDRGLRSGALSSIIRPGTNKPPEAPGAPGGPSKQDDL